MKKKINVIAEIGINHDGSFNKAKKLINLAKKSGADAVKFQLFKPEDLYISVNKSFKSASKFQLKKQEIYKLRQYAKKKNIKFICTAFSLESASFLKSIKVDAIKIASMDANNYLLIEHCLSLNLPLIISTGMCNINDLKKLSKVVKNSKNISILHCLSNYPSKINDINLGSLKKIKKIFNKNILIGYSDHTVGYIACITAITQGATILEKHFTIQKKDYFDHVHSADEQDMTIITNFAKNYNLCLGNPNFLNKRKDLSNKKLFRRGVYCKIKIKKGSLLSEENIIMARPQKNSRIELDKNLFRKKVNKTLNKNTLVDIKNIKN